MKNSAFETLAIRNQMNRTHHNEHSTPLYLTSSFTFDSAKHGEALFNNEMEGNLYSRFSNPNTDEFVQKMCLLEQCEAGVATASGMAAVFTSLVALLKMGDHVVASSAIFGNSLYILNNILPNMGIESSLVAADDNRAFKKAIKPETKMIFVETPSNPTLKMIDLQYLGELSKQHNLLLVVDNCFATPYLQQPIKFGASLVLHSATKYIDGQGRVLGGIIVGNTEPVNQCYDFLRRTGACLSPFNAWVLSKSLETLAIRMDRHCDNAEKLANYLIDHSDIDNIIYPHHPSYPQYALAKSQMKRGGGLVGCVIKGGAKKATRFLNALKLHSLTANLGDSRSIATHPASTTHSKLTKQEQEAVDISPGFIRFSVGLEYIDDIIQDINQALKISNNV